MAGLLDFFLPNASQDDTLPFAAGLLGGRGNFGANLGQGLLGVQANRDTRTLKEMQRIQLQQAQQAMQDEAQLRQYMQSQQAPQQPQSPQPSSGQNFLGANPDFQPLQAAPGVKSANVMPAPQGPARADLYSQYNARAAGLEAIGSPAALAMAKQFREAAEKSRPKLKDTKTLVDPGTNQRVTVNFYEDGSREVVPFAPDKEKAHFTDEGGQIVPRDPFTGAPVGAAAKKTLSPDTQFLGGVTMRGQNMTDARSREQNATNNRQVIETPAGPIVVDKPTATSRPVTNPSGAPVPGDAQIKRELGAKSVLDLLTDAEGHLKGATNSYLGAAADVGARTVGYSTPGAQEIAALKTIEGALLAQMPRMEGPQSNYDVQNYKEAAGMLGNPTVPREQKQVAIDTIRTIQQRYAGGATGNAAKGAIRKYNPATGKIE